MTTVESSSPATVIDARRAELIGRTFIDYRQTAEFLERPIVFDRAEGLSFWDTHGNRYFDAIGGIFVAILGHRHPRVVEAMHRQMEKITFAAPLHAISDATLDFIEKVGQVTPTGLDYVKPFSGGSESTESALKFVRQYFKQTGRPGKYKIVSRYAGYHGGTFGSMSASGTGPRKTPFEPQMPGFLKAFTPNHYRDDFEDWDRCNRFAAKQVEDLIVAEDPATVAAVIVEPVGNTGGIITPTEEYFRMLRDICDRHAVALIFDEVITGFGRTGRMFGAQSFGVTPDVICAGKALSSGMIPLGSMIARSDMAEAFYGEADAGIQFAHGHTYAGNPLACAAGSAVIDEIVEQGLCEKAERLGGYLRRQLASLASLGVVREVRGRGMLLGVELQDPDTGRPFPEGRKLGTALKRTALDHGLILRIDPDWFAVAPALIAEESDLDEMVEMIKSALRDALEHVTTRKAGQGEA